MDRRKHDRFSRRIQVRYWPTGQFDKEKIGYTKDLSEGGAFVLTPKPLKPGTRIQLEVGPEGARGFFLEAVVARSVPVPRELQAKGIKASGMGVRFLGVRELLNDLLPKTAPSPLATKEIDRSLLDQALGTTQTPPRPTGPGPGQRSSPSPRPATPAASARPAGSDAVSESKSDAAGSATLIAEKPAKRARGSRSRAYRTETWPDRQERETRKKTPGPPATIMRYPVSFPSLSVFLSSWDRDLRFGGLFVSTAHPAELDSEVELELHLPESETVLRVRAQVVHIHEAQCGSGEPNLISGMGVEFENAEVLGALRQFAESMR